MERNRTGIEIKAIDDAAVTIGGYGVVWGGVDLEGEQFGPDTDFWLDRLPGAKPVLFDHGADATVGKAVIGATTKIEADDFGLWVEAQLNRANQYADYVLELLKAGALGYSSGALAHLVERVTGNGPTRIKSWPIGEFSLTPTPAEPRTLGVAEIRSLVDLADGLRALLPEDAGNASAQGEERAQGDAPAAERETTITIVEDEMSEDTKAFDVDELAEKVVASLKAQGMDAGFLTPGEGQQAGEDAQTKHLKNFREYLRTGTKAAMEVGTVGEGGYLVPQLYSNELITALTDMSILRRAGARVLSVGGSTAFNVPTMTKAAAAVLTDEEGNYDEAEPTFGQVPFVPYKYTKLVKVSEELVLDSRIDLMSQVLLPDAAQAFAAAENGAFTTGNGTTAPQGIVTGGTVGVTAASTSAIDADEVIDLYHALGYLYRQNAVWFMHDSTAKAIRKLINGAGDYIWQPGLQAGQPDRLLGRPVFTLNSMAEIGAAAKVMVFADPAYFWIADFAAMSMQRLNELYAYTGQVGFRWFRRFDSNVMLAEAVQVLQMKA